MFKKSVVVQLLFTLTPLLITLGVPVSGCAQTVAPSKAKPVAQPQRKEESVGNVAASIQEKNASSRTASGAVGVLSFSFALPAGWSQVEPTRVLSILRSEGNELTPLFAYESPNGGLLYGTWREYSADQFVSAHAMAQDVPAMPPSWGINKRDVLSRVDKATNLDYAVMRATGLGDGLNLSLSGKVQTVSVWIDAPVTYLDKSEAKSGLVSIYFRGPLETFAQSQDVLDEFMNSLKPNQVTLLSLADYKSRTAPKQSAVTVVKPSTPAKVEVPAISVGKDAKQRQLLVEDILDKASKDIEKVSKEIIDKAKRDVRQVFSNP